MLILKFWLKVHLISYTVLNVSCFFFLYRYIVIFYRGEIKLADFGLARLYEADERLAFIYIEFLLRSN